MDTLTFLQHYWWFVISLLGAVLVFLLFVQGGQALLYDLGRTEEERTMIVNSLGRKWELTFTTLVTFGGAFFASFPLFYSTSFGGAVYVWMAILLCFVLQAVAYEYRRKPGNIFGERTYNIFLLINGLLGPLLLGMAVGTLFTGANFTVDRLNLAETGAAAVISQWTTPWHGLEAVANPRNWALGLSVALLSMILACQFLARDIDDETIRQRIRHRLRRLSGGFVAVFVIWLLCLLLADGWTADPATGTISVEPYKYLHNLQAMPWVAVMLAAGIAAAYINLVIREFGSLPFAVIKLGRFAFVCSLALLFSVIWALFACKKRTDMLKLKAVNRKIVKERGGTGRMACCYLGQGKEPKH